MNIKQITLVDIKGTNPYTNLAIEEHLEKTCANKDEIILMLWQMEKSVIIGHSQDLMAEVNVEKCKKDGVNIVRRKSGGGAVYQDKGNLNFSFIWFCHDCTINNTYDVVLETFKKLGMNVEKMGRNDIAIHQGRKTFKVSGNAFISNSTFSLHHGTILVDLNIGDAAKYLTPSVEKLTAKGIDSVKERIANISDIIPNISIDKVKKEFIKSAEKEFNTKIKIHDELTESKLIDNEHVMKLKKLYEGRHWIYNDQAFYSFKEKKLFSWGDTEIKAFVENNWICSLGITSDSLETGWIDIITSEVHNNKTRPHEWKSKLTELSIAHPQHKQVFLDLGKTFFKSFSL